MYKPRELILAHQSRLKFFSWVELYLASKKLPSEIIADSSSKTILDPMWMLTQSGKNYSKLFIDKLYQNYQALVWNRVHYSELGGMGAVVNSGIGPTWAHFVYNRNWFWQQKKAPVIAFLLSLLPGVKKVYMVGSASLEVSHSSSDVDLAIECYAGFVLTARLWVKLALKVFMLDVHPLHYELLRYVDYIFGKITFRARSKQQRRDVWFNQRIWKFKNRPGQKIDCGLFFESFQDWQERDSARSKDADYYSISRLMEIKFATPSLKTFLSEVSSGSGNKIFYLDFGWASKVIFLALQPVKFILAYLTWPLSLLQILWSQLKPSYNPDHICHYDLCAFYPRHSNPSLLYNLQNLR